MKIFQLYGAPIRTVEHLGLRAQSVTLLNQIVNLLAALQDALNSLVECDLGLQQFVSGYVS